MARRALSITFARYENSMYPGETLDAVLLTLMEPKSSGHSVDPNREPDSVRRMGRCIVAVVVARADGCRNTGNERQGKQS